MIIFVFGFLIILQGTGGFISFDYKTDKNIEYTTNNTLTNDLTTNTQSKKVNKQEKVTVTNSKNKKINYFSLIKIVTGIILLVKATEFSVKTNRNFNLRTEEKLLPLIVNNN